MISEIIEALFKVGLDWDLENVNNAIDNPEWNQDIYVHDWERYIPEEIQEKWTELSRDIQAAFIYMAEIRAENEEWE